MAEVETATLDDLIRTKMESERDDLITMDVQGAERPGFDGANQTLRRNDVKILMEFWPSGLRSIGTDPRELIRKLYDYGFVITIMDEPGRAPDLMKISDNLENGTNKQAAVNLLLEKAVSGNP